MNKKTAKNQKKTSSYDGDKIVKAFKCLDKDGKAVRHTRRTCTNREYYRDLMRARRAFTKEQETAKTQKKAKTVKTAKKAPKAAKTAYKRVQVSKGVWIKKEVTSAKKATKKAKRVDRSVQAVRRAIRTLAKGGSLL